MSSISMFADFSSCMRTQLDHIISSIRNVAKLCSIREYQFWDLLCMVANVISLLRTTKTYIYNLKDPSRSTFWMSIVGSCTAIDSHKISRFIVVKLGYFDAACLHQRNQKGQDCISGASLPHRRNPLDLTVWIRRLFPTPSPDDNVYMLALIQAHPWPCQLILHQQLHKLELRSSLIVSTITSRKFRRQNQIFTTDLKQWSPGVLGLDSHLTNLPICQYGLEIFFRQL